MDLVEIINESRIDFSKIPLHDGWNPNPNIFEEGNLKGMIAQVLVENWLKQCDGVKIDYCSDVTSSSGYELRHTNMGVTVYKDGKSVHEYDFLFFYNEKLFIVEVKSSKISGYQKKINRAFDIAKEVYHTDNIGMLLFFPIYSNRVKSAKKIEEDYMNVNCINIGFTSNQMKKFLEDFCITPEGYEYVSDKIYFWEFLFEKKSELNINFDYKKMCS